ncbi:MAG: hypothetical protein LIO43_02495 [Clostridiales bacterium]|nr:hypothetical protein [Clostridiales bacterium]
MATFSDAYLANEACVYNLLKNWGTKDASVTYSNGVAKGQTCVTPEFSGQESTPYVTVNGTVFYNMSAQDALDADTQSILSDLTQVNTSKNADDNMRRIHSVSSQFICGDAQLSNNAENVFYGDTITLNAPSGYNVYKWVVTANGTTKEVPGSASYTTAITSDTQITAYCSTESAQDTVKLRVLDMYGNPINEYDIAQNTALTLASNKYLIGDTEYAVSDTPFYRFKGWQVNGKNFNYETYNLADIADQNGVVAIRPCFKAEQSFTVNMDGVSVTDENGNPLYYDSTAAVKAQDGAYGILAEINGVYYVVSYETQYSFYVVGDINLYSLVKAGTGEYTIKGADGAVKVVLNDAESLRKLNSKLPFAYSIAQPKADGSYTAYNAWSKLSTDNPSSAKVTEVGTIYTTDASAATADSFVIGNSAVKLIAAKTPLDTNQYFLRFTSTNGKTVYTRPYVKYEFTDENGTVIQTIEYGNVESN